MAKLKVLINGYAKELENGWLASSTVVLVRSGNQVIISDPGCNKEGLVRALKVEGLETKDINFVFLTHGHIDHTLLAGIFENAKFVTFESLMYDKDLQLDFKENILGQGTKIIKTPGHSVEHISLLVDTDEGKYAIAGDVFWWVDGEKQVINVNKEDNAHPAELNMENLVASRRELLKIANYIIPGHGKTFKVEK